MTPPVFYLADTDVAVGVECALSGPEAHHAATVRRLRPGEAVVLTDGRGTALDATVTEAGRRELRCVVAARRVEAAPAVTLTVVQALPKGERADLAVELLTEVGVHRIVPWAAARSVTRWEGQKADRGRQRWQKVARAAAKQSRRIWWPTVDELHDTEAVTRRVKEAGSAYVLDAEASESMTDLVTRHGDATDVVVIVGPEGGIGEDEMQQFVDSGAARVRLGPTVLRTSTAGLVAASVVLSRQWS